MKKTRGREGESPRRVGGSEGLRAEDADTNLYPPRDGGTAGERGAHADLVCRCWGNGFPGLRCASLESWRSPRLPACTRQQVRTRFELNSITPSCFIY